jgi:hypothetical protein
MIDEIRIYEAAEGRAAATRQRLHTEVRLHFADDKAPITAAPSIGTDPQWKAIEPASEGNGSLLQTRTVSLLSPTVPGLLLG